MLDYAAASQKTAADLKTIATTSQIAQLSRLTLPEIEILTEQIAQVVPAGNVPGLILSGLTRLEGRQVPVVEQQRHLGLLFHGVGMLLDKAVYSAVFAGPAAILMAYQKLLQLAGKDIHTAFPEGTWQFYLSFALREDAARHANETVGFRRSLAVHKIALSDSAALAAWLMASVITLQNFNRLLENEWRERTYTALLQQEDASHHAAYAEWEKLRPYLRGPDGKDEDYPAYRRRKFDGFFKGLLQQLPPDKQKTLTAAITNAEQESLPAYLRQMTILAQLEPGQHQETRVPYGLEEACLGIVYRGQYTLFPLVDPGTGAFVDVHRMRQIAAGILSAGQAHAAAEVDLLLAQAPRASQSALRKHKEAQQVAHSLATTPIIINWDQRSAKLPLGAIRQSHRGIGDHALTLFFTEDSTVFDQSHIFFDGAWGSALAEIMTNEALSWALYLAQLPAATTATVTHIPMAASPKFREAAERVRLPIEANAERSGVRLDRVLALRRLFKTRNDLVTVTVNDLLILYRALHGARYTPSSLLRQHIEALKAQDRKIYSLVQDAINKLQQHNPALLIPMDASQHSPSERLFPTTFRNPMSDLWDWHEATLTALSDYKEAAGDRALAYQIFDERQRHYLRLIAGFGELMRKYKDIALSGQSTSTMSIKMLAHMPDVMQRLLDQIPGQFEVLNEIIKGEEVFSNVGRVAKGSTLRRFMTAKDDNQQKTLAWGVLTDDHDNMVISLRDFRPHVTVLRELHMAALADLIAQDFLDSYVDGFNLFIRQLREITVSSRETQSRP